MEKIEIADNQLDMVKFVRTKNQTCSCKIMHLITKLSLEKSDL